VADGGGDAAAGDAPIDWAWASMAPWGRCRMVTTVRKSTGSRKA
jgi:hypothetical protein